MARSWLPALAFVLGLGMFVAALGQSPRASGPNLLVNGGFESGTAGWVVTGGAATVETTNVVAGNALHITSTDTVTVRQTVAVEAGATYSATINAAGAAGGQAAVVFQFLDADFTEVGGAPPLAVANLAASYAPITAVDAAPETAAYLVLTVRLAPITANPLDAFVDEASLITHWDQRARWARDVGSDRSIGEMRTAYVDEGIRTICVVPLLNRGRSIGVVGLYHDTDRTWPDDEVALETLLNGKRMLLIYGDRGFSTKPLR